MMLISRKIETTETHLYDGRYAASEMRKMLAQGWKLESHDPQTQAPAIEATFTKESI